MNAQINDNFMAHLIDKDALVAEIKRRIKEIDEIGTYLSPKGTLTNLLCYLNDVEVKEVDIDEEIDENYQKDTSTLKTKKQYAEIAKQIAVIKCEKKSPITGGEMQLMQEKSSVKFRGEEISFIKKFYHCVESGQEFTDTELDNDNMWSIFRAYWERKGFEHFYDIDGYREEQESVSKDLEQAANRYAKEEYNRKNPATLPDRCIGCYAPIMYAFKTGAQWQREQMMKDAVDGWLKISQSWNNYQ